MIDRNLNMLIRSGSQSSWESAETLGLLFRGHPGPKVRLARKALALVERYGLPTIFATPALYLCRRELAETLLACDPDVLEATGVRWATQMRRVLQRQFPHWFDDAEANRRGGWRKFDASAPVSVVLPVHNVRSYLRQSIESCLAQTYRNVELIVVDDGSTDDVGAALRRYDDPRLHLLRHDRNQGVAAALNTGFAAARGGFLTWTSDDNYYHPRAIEEMVGFLQTYGEIDFVYAEMYIIDKDRPAPPWRLWEVKPPDWLWARESNPIGACFMYRRRVYDELGGYDSKAFLVEDYEYWLRIARRFRMQRLFKSLYYYRYHEDTLTARHARSEVLARLRQVRRLHGVRA